MTAACLHAAEVERADKSVGNGIAVEDGPYWARGAYGIHGKGFEGVADGMTQVECLADTAFCGVFLDDALLHFYGVGHHALQVVVVDDVKVER